LDALNVDMELLRRIGEIRGAVEKLDEGDPSSDRPLREAAESVRERTGADLPEIRKLLDLMVWSVDATDPGQRRPTSRLANGILAAAEAAEEALFSGTAAEHRTLIAQAGGTLLLAVDQDPAEWESWRPEGGPGEEAPPGAGQDVAALSGNRASPPKDPPPQGTTLDDIASFMVQMDPEDRSEAIRLRELLEEMPTESGTPEDFRPIHGEMIQLLRDVTDPPRTRKTARKEAVDRVGELLEEASFFFEEMEAVEAAALSSSAQGEEDHGEQDVGVKEEEALIPEAKEAPSTTPQGSREPAHEPQAEEEDQVFPDSEPLPEAVDPDLILDFVTEGFEYLEQAEEALLILEADPGDKEAVNVVFRAFHTIKGVSGFLELHRISNLAHHAETLLSRVRDDELRYTGVVADLSLRGIDVLKALLDSVRDGVSDGVVRLAPDYGPLFNVLADPELLGKIRAGTIQGMSGQADPEEQDGNEGMDPAEPEGEEGGGDGPRRAKTSESSVRVRTDRLDRLVDMVGELVIAHSMLAQDPTILMDRGNLSRKVDHSAKILRELQDLSTSLRMVPLKPAFRKVTRVVRDLSKKVGKPVELVTDGEDTEIDRTMVDVLADPLIHMVRNSLDHGLEAPDERAAAGKPPKGKIRISAFQAGGNVVIEVSDDGRGLNREKILSKAIERGVVDSDRGMTDREIYNLIFAPGFSTAEKVTEVSGRGVGMDVVRRNVESLRGRVAIDSEPGNGSTFSIHLPLTLAITDGMVIRVGSQRYIIPSVKIHMSLRPEAEALSTVSGKGEMVLIQGDLLPVIRLHSLWGIADAVEDPKKGLLVIVGEGRDRSALLVDELVTQQQFVVKPLSGVVADTQGVAGGAIMGNGDVGLILDPDGIIAMSRGLGHAAAA